MKRDMDLVRTLLLYVEEEHKGDDFLDVDTESFEGYESADVYGHLDILIDAGLLHDHTQRSDITPLTGGLTWDGHDFISATQDKDIWEKTKEIDKKAGGWTADSLLEIAKGIVIAAGTAALTGGPS